MLLSSEENVRVGALTCVSMSLVLLVSQESRKLSVAIAYLAAMVLCEAGLLDGQ